MQQLVLAKVGDVDFRASMSAYNRRLLALIDSVRFDVWAGIGAVSDRRYTRIDLLQVSDSDDQLLGHKLVLQKHEQR